MKHLSYEYKIWNLHPFSKEINEVLLNHLQRDYA